MAQLEDVEERMRSAVLGALKIEAMGMSHDEVAHLLLEAMDDGELRVRVRELQTGVRECELTCQ